MLSIAIACGQIVCGGAIEPVLTNFVMRKILPLVFAVRAGEAVLDQTR